MSLSIETFLQAQKTLSDTESFEETGSTISTKIQAAVSSAIGETNNPERPNLITTISQRIDEPNIKDTLVLLVQWLDALVGIAVGENGDVELNSFIDKQKPTALAYSKTIKNIQNFLETLNRTRPLNEICETAITKTFETLKQNCSTANNRIGQILRSLK